MSKDRNAYDLVCEYGDRIDNGRTLRNIFDHGVGEMEELREEVEALEDGRLAGKDGVVGEAIDVVACVYDLIRRSSPDLPQFKVANILDRVRSVDAVATGGKPALRAALRAAEARMTLLEIALTSRGSEVELSVQKAAIDVAACMFDIVESRAPGASQDRVLDVLEDKLKNWERDYAHSIHRVRL
jgi:hypothetical protein